MCHDCADDVGLFIFFSGCSGVAVGFGAAGSGVVGVVPPSVSN